MEPFLQARYQPPRNGWRAGFLIATGHALLEILLVAIIAIGLQDFLGNKKIQFIIALVGGSLLFFMGIKMLTNSLKGQVHTFSQAEQLSPAKPYRLMFLGFIATLSNPFWYAWWVSVPTSYLSQTAALTLMPLIFFTLGHISADYVWDVGLAVAIEKGTQRIDIRFYKWLFAASAIFLVYLGFIFLISAHEQWINLTQGQGLILKI